MPYNGYVFTVCASVMSPTNELPRNLSLSFISDMSCDRNVENWYAHNKAVIVRDVVHNAVSKIVGTEHSDEDIAKFIDGVTANIRRFSHAETIGIVAPTLGAPNSVQNVANIDTVAHIVNVKREAGSGTLLLVTYVDTENDSKEEIEAAYESSCMDILSLVEEYSIEDLLQEDTLQEIGKKVEYVVGGKTFVFRSDQTVNCLGHPQQL